jgi:hypothetical protein
MQVSPMTDARSPINKLVLVFPTDWDRFDLDRIRSAYAAITQGSPAAPEDTAASDLETTALRVGEGHISGWLEESVPELSDLIGTSPLPFQTNEISALTTHTGTLRIIVEPLETPMATAAFALRICRGLVGSGCAGVFLPSIVRLHSPACIESTLAQGNGIESAIKLLLSARDTESWMTTRGLTAFGLPEVETEIVGGALNSAYFRILDIAAHVLMTGNALPEGTQVHVGPELLQVHEGPRGPGDPMIPFNGHFGVITLALP